jgi:hypothetical protein
MHHDTTTDHAKLPLTVKTATYLIRGLGLTCVRKDGEFKVGIPGAPEADYFTEDAEDALLTARAMALELAGLRCTGCLCTCGVTHGEGEDCPTQGRTEREMEQDAETARQCPGCRQTEDCHCHDSTPTT